MKCVIAHRDLLIFGSKLNTCLVLNDTNISNFHQLKVVGCVSEIYII